MSDPSTRRPATRRARATTSRASTHAGAFVRSLPGAITAAGGTGATAYAGSAHSTIAVIATAATGLITTGVTTVVPWLFWWRAQDPLRRLRWWQRHGRLDDVTGTQLLALHENAVREATRARATAPLPDESGKSSTE